MGNHAYRSLKSSDELLQRGGSLRRSPNGAERRRDVVRVPIAPISAELRRTAAIDKEDYEEGADRIERDVQTNADFNLTPTQDSQDKQGPDTLGGVNIVTNHGVPHNTSGFGSMESGAIQRMASPPVEQLVPRLGGIAEQMIANVQGRKQIMEQEAAQKAAKAASVRSTGHQPSNAIKQYIKAIEGICLEFYHDSSGYCTIGYGRLLGTRGCKSSDLKTVSSQDADKYFEADLMTKAVDPMAQKLGAVALTQYEYDALVSYFFNTGVGSSPKLIQHLYASKYEEAMTEMNINKSDGKVIPGLEKRRQEERDIFAGKGYPSRTQAACTESQKQKARASAASS